MDTGTDALNRLVTPPLSRRVHVAQQQAIYTSALEEPIEWGTKVVSALRERVAGAALHLQFHLALVRSDKSWFDLRRSLGLDFQLVEEEDGYRLEVATIDDQRTKLTVSCLTVSAGATTLVPFDLQEHLSDAAAVVWQVKDHVDEAITKGVLGRLKFIITPSILLCHGMPEPTSLLKAANELARAPFDELNLHQWSQLATKPVRCDMMWQWNFI